MNSVQKKAVFLKELREKVILFLFLYVKRKSKCKTLTLRDLVMTFLEFVSIRLLESSFSVVLMKYQPPFYVLVICFLL